MVFNPRHSWVCWTVIGLIACFAREAHSAEVRFSRDILPIFSDNCFACHGPDQNKRQGGLRLDIPGEAFKAAESGDIPIVAGKPTEGTLIARIFSSDPDSLMPPPDSRKKLTAAQKELIKRWVAVGAKYEQHWAFVAPMRHDIPAVSKESWVRTPIDRFVLARL